MDDESLFERAMRGVRPMEGPGRRVGKPSRRARLERRGAAPSVRFEIARVGDGVEGWAGEPGERALADLRAGRHPAERKVDLHGLTAEEARLTLRDVLGTAWATGQRSIEVIHGRGLRSAGGAVLKEALPGWLAEAPHARRILAFTSAGPGGRRGGSTRILLRRRKR